MINNLPEVPPDWKDFHMAVIKCPTKSFVVRIPLETPPYHEEKDQLLKVRGHMVREKDLK